MYQEELSLLKRQNISRSLSFRAAIVGNSKDEDLDVSTMEDLHGTDQLHVDELNNIESCQCVRVSTKQVNRQQLLFSRIIQLRLENVHDRFVTRLLWQGYLSERKLRINPLAIISQL